MKQTVLWLLFVGFPWSRLQVGTTRSKANYKLFNITKLLSCSNSLCSLPTAPFIVIEELNLFQHCPRKNMQIQITEPKKSYLNLPCWKRKMIEDDFWPCRPLKNQPDVIMPGRIRWLLSKPRRFIAAKAQNSVVEPRAQSGWLGQQRTRPIRSFSYWVRYQRTYLPTYLPTYFPTYKLAS